MEIKKGDLVFLHSYETTLEKVQEVTKAGNIRVGGKLFNKKGILRGGSKFSLIHIKIATQEQINKFMYEKDVYERRRYIENKVWGCGNLETLKKICNLLEQKQTIKINSNDHKNFVNAKLKELKEKLL